MDFYSGIVYTLFLVVTCFLAYQAERFNYNKVLVFATYVFVVGFWAIRYGIGWDYGGYMDIFSQIKYYDKSYVEPAYYWLNRLFAFSPYGYVYVIGITTAVIYFFLFKFFVREKMLFYGLFFSIAFQLQNMISTQIRQAFVVVIFLWAFHYIDEKKYWKYLIITALSMLVHFSAIFILFVPLLSKIRLTKVVALGGIFLCFGLLMIGAFKTIGTTVMQAFPLYEKYQQMTMRMEAEDVGFSIVMFFWLIIAVMITVFRDSIQKPKMYNVYILGVMGYLVFFEFHLLNRVMQYFMMLSIPLMVNLCKNNFRNGIIMFTVSLIAYMLLCTKEPNFYGIQPYQTIFRDKPIQQYR